ASLGALIGAAALVRGFHQIFLGERSEGERKGPEAAGFVQAPDFSLGETGLALAVIVVWLVLGLFPMLFIHPVENTLLERPGVGGTAVSGTGDGGREMGLWAFCASRGASELFLSRPPSPV